MNRCDFASMQEFNAFRAAYQRQRRAFCREHGRCSGCFSRRRKIATGRRSCIVCLKRAKERYRVEISWRLANNICTRCGVPKGENATKWLCRPCADIHAKKQLARTEKRKLGLQ